MSDLLTLDQVIELLHAAIQQAGSAARFANRHHFNQEYICFVKTRYRRPGPAILAALGLEKVILYRPLQCEGKPMPSTTIKYFTYLHLSHKLQEVSKPICELAELLEKTLPDGPEKSAGMRKLLEAKDCFVRAVLP